jgi:ABC-2 type transport system ATP-binding protein
LAIQGVQVDGRSRQSDEIRRRLGIVPQEVALFPLLTARENLEIFGKLNGLDGAALKSQVADALTWTGLADRADERTGAFSGGMKRRLNIACGVLHKPDIVLLDEPTVGVDPQSRERIWEMLRELRDKGAALLLTTHQLDEAQRVCDRIVIIDHGKTIASGTFSELVEQTVGTQRRVTIRTSTPQALQGIDGQVQVEGDTVRTKVREVGEELPALLGRIFQAGGRIEDVQIEPPSLQSVFLHLTGRELRE